MRSPVVERAYSALLGLTTLTILLQSVWAGIFLEHDGQRDSATTALDAHQGGAEAAVVLGVLTAIVAVVWLRDRRDVWIGSVSLAVLLIAEFGLGRAVHDNGKDSLTAIHVPLGVLIMALAVWLPTRRRRRVTAPTS